jgi:hypothetical protein
MVAEAQRWCFSNGKRDMAKGKGLKKAPGRIIGRWKEEAIKANPGASDADLARIINERAKGEGYDYTITPEKVRIKGKKQSAPQRQPAPPSAPKATPVVSSTPAAPSSQSEGALMNDLRAFVRLVGKEGAKDLLVDLIDRL